MGIYRREADGYNITPSLGAAAPRRRGAGAEKAKEYTRMGLRVADHDLWRRVGPSSTRPRLKSREGGERAKERERQGKGERSCSLRLSWIEDLPEAQRKMKEEEGTLAR